MSHIAPIKASEPQLTSPTLVPEGPIQALPGEIRKFIIILTNQSEKTRLVSRSWNDHTFAAVQDPTKLELKQTIRLIAENLNPDEHAQYIVDLAELLFAHQSHSDYVATPVEVRRLFLVVKGHVIGVLRKLPMEERDQLQIAIGHQLPDSMKDLFEISKLHITIFNDVDLDTFFTLLQSFQPLSTNDRGEAVVEVVEDNEKNVIEFVKLLLANGPISEDHRGLAVAQATKNNNSKLVILLLTNGMVSEDNIRGALSWASHNDNLELVRLLLSKTVLSDDARGHAVAGYARGNNLKLIRLFLAHGPITESRRGEAVSKASRRNNLELVRLLLANGPISKEDLGDAVCWAAQKGHLEAVRLLLANGPISENHRKKNSKRST